MSLTELITIENGAVEQSNFYGYHVSRMKHMPLMHIKIQTDNHPTGARRSHLAREPSNFSDADRAAVAG